MSLGPLFDQAAAERFYRRGFQYAAQATPEQARGWLASEQALEQKLGDTVAPLIAAAAELYQDETGACPWCGGLRHDAEDF